MTTPDDLAGLRAEVVALLGEAHRTQPCSCGLTTYATCVHPGARSHEERRADAVMPVLARLAAERDQARALVRDMTDPGECWFDHHGYCQEHGWFDTDPACPHGRAKKLGLTDTEETK